MITTIIMVSWTQNFVVTVIRFIHLQCPPALVVVTVHHYYYEMKQIQSWNFLQQSLVRLYRNCCLEKGW